MAVKFLGAAPISTEASNATPTINVDAVELHSITALAVPITSLTVTGSTRLKFILRVKDNGTSRGFALGTNFQNSDQATIPASTTVGKTHQLGFIRDTVVGKWICVASVTY